MNKDFFEIIEKYDALALFRHVFPDGDALGSQFGLKFWLQCAYPEKKIVALGDGEGQDDIFPSSDTIGDDELKCACAIILDTANIDRIDDQRYKLCQTIIKIDHHPVVETYGDLNIVEESASSTCEVLTKMLMAEDKPCSKEAAKFFYCGMLTDSQKFSIPSVSAQTMACAAWLSKQGIDISGLNHQMFATDLKSFKFDAYLKNSCTVINDQLIYKIIEQEEYERFGLSFTEAKDKVNAFAGIGGIEVWALFTRNPNEEGHLYNGSLRSYRKTINDIANDYHGGGHKLASGVKKLTKQDIDELLSRLLKRIAE